MLCLERIAFSLISAIGDMGILEGAGPPTEQSNPLRLVAMLAGI